jgi:hypothetical protein
MAPKDTFFRSSDMSLTQLYIANEIGREVVSALGELGQVQFRDVSTPLPRAFRAELTCVVCASLTPTPMRSNVLSPRKSAAWTMWRDNFVCEQTPQQAVCLYGKGE